MRQHERRINAAILDEAEKPLCSAAAAGAKLRFEKVPAQFECRGCDWHGGLEKGSFACPECGGENLKMTAGREFYVENIKVE